MEESLEGYTILAATVYSHISSLVVVQPSTTANEVVKSCSLLCRLTSTFILNKIYMYGLQHCVGSRVIRPSFHTVLSLRCSLVIMLNCVSELVSDKALHAGRTLIKISKEHRKTKIKKLFSSFSNVFIVILLPWLGRESWCIQCPDVLYRTSIVNGFSLPLEFDMVEYLLSTLRFDQRMSTDEWSTGLKRQG